MKKDNPLYSLIDLARCIASPSCVFSCFIVTLIFAQSFLGALEIPENMALLAILSARPGCNLTVNKNHKIDRMNNVYVIILKQSLSLN